MTGLIRKVSLERLVGSSKLVIVARPAEPPERKERIDITPPGRKPSGAFPPFIRIRRRFVVEEILHSKFHPPPPPLNPRVTPDVTPAPGDVIEVDAAAYDYDLGVHRKEFVDKILKGTIHEHYEPEDLPENLSAPRLVFLQRWGEVWSFAFDPGEEGLGLRARVEKLLEGDP